MADRYCEVCGWRIGSGGEAEFEQHRKSHLAKDVEPDTTKPAEPDFRRSWVRKGKEDKP